MTTCRIVLADDHDIFREGLKSLMGKNEELRVVGAVKNGKELLAVLKTVECDLVVLDIAMPEMDGLTALKEVSRLYPNVKVLMLSMLNDHAHFAQAHTFGAAGYLAKDDAGDELLRAVEKLMKGKAYVSPSVVTLLAERQVHQIEGGKSQSVEVLTRREKQVLAYVARGFTNKNIATELKISIHTVENHRAHLTEKLGMKNVASLVKFAIEKGIV